MVTAHGAVHCTVPLLTSDHTALAAVIKELRRMANYPFKLTCEGRYESKAAYFNSETIITIIMKFTRIMDTSYKMMRLFFHQVSFIINTLFPPLRQTLYAAAICRRVGALRRQQTDALGGHPSGSRKMLSRRCYIGL